MALDYNVASQEHVVNLGDGVPGKSPVAQVINYKQIEDMGLSTSHGTTIKKLSNGAEVNLGNLNNITVKLPKEADLPNGLSVDVLSDLGKEAAKQQQLTERLGNTDTTRILGNRGIEPTYENAVRLYNTPGPIIFSCYWDRDYEAGRKVPDMKQEFAQLETGLKKLNQDVVDKFESLSKAFPTEAVKFANDFTEKVKDMSNDAIFGKQAEKTFAASMAIVEKFQNEQLKANNMDMQSYSQSRQHDNSMQSDMESSILKTLQSQKTCKRGDLFRSYVSTVQNYKSLSAEEHKKIKSNFHRALGALQRDGALRSNPYRSEFTMASQKGLHVDRAKTLKPSVSKELPVAREKER